MEKLYIKNNRYVYYPDYNKLINADLQDIFENSAKGNLELPTVDKEVNLEILEKEVANINQIILEVTRSCNLRCKYCAFGGDYFFERTHSPDKMPFTVAKKGIDYLAELFRYRKDKTFSVSFYGGEPFIHFDLIKAVVQYTREKLSNLDIDFYLTTNGTLLNEEIIRYIIKNNFSVLVSLDGPQPVHDSKRVFKNNKGSHRVITRNLKKIKSINPDYFRERIRFAATVSPDLSLLERYHYFTKDGLVKDQGFSSSMVDPEGTRYFEKLKGRKDSMKNEIQEIFSHIKDKLLKNESLVPFEQNFLKTIKDTGKHCSSGAYSTLAGTCLFGTRLFLDVFGTFHTCERVNHTFPIGNIDNGLDFKRMVKMANEFKMLVKEKCSNCVARHFCKICYAGADGNGEFTVSQKFCTKMKESVRFRLETFIDFKTHSAL